MELLEYPLLYDDQRSIQAYWDTLADLAATLVGALVVTGIWLAARPSGGRAR